MRKPIQSKLRFLRFLVKPLLVLLLINGYQGMAIAQTAIISPCNCLSNQSVPGDGQFVANISVSSGTLETWYIAVGEINGLYDPSSLDPPAAPFPFMTGPTGFNLTEAPAGSGNYQMSGNHIDGQGFTLTLTNGGPTAADSIAIVVSPGTCTYPNPQIVGEGSLCEALEGDYSVALDPNSSYVWTLGSGGTFSDINVNEVTVAWNEDDPGPHLLSVEQTSLNGCVVVDEIEVTLEDTIAMACNNYVQVSLNINCIGELTADMFLEDPAYENESYEIFLETLDGAPIPGNIVTTEHIGQTLVVSVQHICSGNLCWSYMTVEDNITPAMDCVTDTIGCDDPYTPEDIGFPVDFLSPPIQIAPNSYLGQGPDLCGPLSLVYEDETIKNDCTEEFAAVVIRRWAATDAGGNTSVCYDTIKTLRTGLEELAFPPHYDDLLGGEPTLEACGPWDKLPNGHPHPDYTGYPAGPLCGNLQIDFIDHRIPLCGPNSFKIVRKWIVMDECTNEVFDTNQLIAVMDTRPPSLAKINDFEVSTDDYVCHADVLLPRPFVLRECSGWTYEVAYILGDENGNLPLGAPYVTDARVKNNNDGTYTLLDLPKGRTWVQYTVTDDCDNSSVLYYVITVNDELPPIAICDQHVVVSLNDTGVGYAAALAFDDGSWDNCGEITLKVRRGANSCGVPSNVWLDGMEFCCADVGEDVMVELKVTDSEGLSNICMAIVEVQDKRFPTINCPPNITVSCEFDYSDYSIFGTIVTDPALAKPIIINDIYNPNTRPNHVWGYDGVAYDNCDLEVEIIRETEVIDQCGEGTIRRSFRVTDPQGNSDVCTQTISVVDLNPFYINKNNPLDPNDDVVWPKDYVLNGCLDDAYDPESLPAGFDKPILSDDHCSLVAYDHEDMVFQYVDGYCYKIIRTWTVIDWCEYDQEHPYEFGYWQYSQVIMIVDDELPSFTAGCESSPLVNQLTEDGCSAKITLSAEADDNCTLAADLEWYYEVDLHSNGIFERVGYSNTVVDNYPYGNHKIKWYVTDECGNVNTCFRVFKVEDHKKPTPICYDGIVTVPMPTTGTVEVFAKSFNICNGCESGSYDNCTPQDQLRYSFSSNVNEVSRVFSCDDIENGILDTIEIEMWVTDLAGNQEFCNTHLILQDNQDICPDAIPDMFDVAGMLRTVDNQRIPSAEVSIVTDHPEYPKYSTSNDNGIFSYKDLYAFENYEISASSNQDPMGGISTLDLIFIQKHLLGLLALNDPYKLIAADINGSESISAADLLELRKLILGVYDELPNNDSWRFIDESATFENPNDPFPFDEIREIDLRFHSLQNNFIGVKIGDVNNSVNLTGNDQLFNRSVDVVTLKSENNNFSKGEVLELPVYYNGSDPVAGMQFTFVYDKEKLEVIGLSSEQIQIDASNYNTQTGIDGIMTVSWNIANGITPGHDLPLFSIKFSAKSNGNIASTISLSDRVLKSEIYTGSNGQLKENVLKLRFDEDVELNTSGLVLYQNMPNPFSTETKILYYLNEENTAKLSVYDLNGRVIYEAINARHLGEGSFTIDAEKDELDGGIYYYKLEAGDQFSTRKMIMIR